MSSELEKQVHENTVSIAVICQKIDNVRDIVERIENNHLAHLSKDIERIEDKVDTLETESSKRSPMANLGTKLLETVIQAIVIAILIVIGLRMS